jgi:hypothetical protein
MDDTSLEELKKSIQTLSGKVDLLSSKKGGGFLAALQSLSPFLSTVLISGAATFATMAYNENQLKLSQIEALDKYRTYLVSEKPEEREFGYQSFIALGYEPFVVKLIKARKDSAGISTLISIDNSKPDSKKQAEATADDIMRSAPSPDQKEAPSPVSSQSQERETEGWAYLGHFVDSKKTWQTRYFEFDVGTKPESLIGQSLIVREQTGALNIREGMPTLTGSFRKITHALSPGSRVKIKEVKEWYATGYLWAKITYGT